MKKNLFTCFLALLCLPVFIGIGSEIRGQGRVAESPGTDLIFWSMFPRSGETRSDIAFSITAQDIDGGPGSVVKSVQSTNLTDKGFSLVDDSISFRQGSLSSPAGGVALIYGELINPDSLSPIQIEFWGFQAVDPLEMDIESLPGTFFDGVLDPRVRKFQLALPFSSDFGYIDLRVGNKLFLEDFLISPTDSVKVSLDLESSMIVFGGPQAAWFEVQYMIARAKKQARFDNPRSLYQNNPEELLDKADYRKQWEESNSRFGAKLSFSSFGGEGVDQALAFLELEDWDLIPGYRELESAKEHLTSAQYEILSADLVGQYFASKISSFRKYQYATPLNLGDSTSVQRVVSLLPSLCDKLEEELGELQASSISSGYSQFLYEWLKLESIQTGSSLLDLIRSELEGELKVRMMASYVDEELAKGDFDLGFLSGLLPQLVDSPWKTYLESLQSRMKLGLELDPVSFMSLDGEQVSFDDFKGTPTLFYFYFSSCAHSANYFHRFLWPIYQETAKQAGYRLVAVSVDDDPELWRSAIAEYSDPSLLNLNLPQTENKSWLDKYLVHAFPRTMLLDGEGKLLSLNLTGENYDAYQASLLELLGIPLQTQTP